MTCNISITIDGQPCCPPVSTPALPETLIVVLAPQQVANFETAASVFNVQELKPSADAYMGGPNGSSILFRSNGFYSVSITSAAALDANGVNEVWPYGVTLFGTRVLGALEGGSKYARFARSGGNGELEFENDILSQLIGDETQRMQWSDEFTVRVEDFQNHESPIFMYAQRYAGFAWPVRFSGVLRVTKIV